MYERGLLHRCTPSCYEKFQIQSKQIYLRNLGWIKDPDVIVCEYSKVLPFVAPELLHQDIHDLEVGSLSFIINACAGA
jgi:hypothetical protein